VARGTQHRKRRPTADARVTPEPKRKESRHDAWEDQLFFSRLRNHAKWVFVLLALVFGLGFVLFGIGSNTGDGGLSDVGDAEDGADLDGDLGVGVYFDLGTKARRDKFLRAMAAEGVVALPPTGSVILPANKRIEEKVTIHTAWPSFQSAAGKAIRYGAESCPRTVDIISRFGGVLIDPMYTDEEIKDIVRAIRKVYTAVMPGPAA